MPLKKLVDHCKRGHQYTEENTGFTRGNIRFCKTCDRMRKDKYQQKTRETRERKVEVTCPVCSRVRLVVATTARRLSKTPSACLSCARKTVRGRMRFAPRDCTKCGEQFIGISGATKVCDKCARRKPMEPATCPICDTKFYGFKSKKTCSQSCARRLRINEQYFGGRLKEAVGWKTKTCQVCCRNVKKKFHIHHVFGHPDHSVLVVLCSGCHDIISKLAMRKNASKSMMRRIFWFANAQRTKQPPTKIFPRELGASDEAAL